MADQTPTPPTLFILDDDVGFVHAAAELARARGFVITIAGTLEQARARLAAQRFDLALLDLSLPDGNGLDLIGRIDLARTQVILVTGRPTVDSALKALRLSVVDYLVKPLAASQFTDLLDTCLRKRPLPILASGAGGLGLAGSSAAMHDVRRQVQRVAPTQAAVLIEGESGVGKRRVAEAIHAESGRSGPFVAIRCAGLAVEQAGRELFGYERGSFNGASSRHAGVFEQAHGGTLFLDGVGALPVPLQLQLLQAVESRSIRRLGGSENVAVDVRLVCTVSGAQGEAGASRLREDLYYRLAEFAITVPPLRARPEDILVIADGVLQELNQRHGVQRMLSQEAGARLLRHPWPGNARELRCVLQRAFLLAENDVLNPEPADVAAPAAAAETGDTITFAVGTPMHEVERRMLFKTLARFGNNKARAAQALGITTKTIYNRLHAYRAAGKPDPAGADHDDA